MKKFVNLIKTHKQKLLITILIIYLLFLTSKISTLESKISDLEDEIKTDIDSINWRIGNIGTIEEVVCELADKLNAGRVLSLYSPFLKLNCSR